MSYIFTLVLVGIAGFILYSAFTGKGKLFSVDNIIKDKIPQFKKLLRPIYFALGFIMLLMALTSAYQNIVYSDVLYRFGDDFPVYFGDIIDADGMIKGSDVNIAGVYNYSKMSSVFSNLQQPEIPEGVSPVFAEAAKDENGNILYLGLGETQPGQNQTYSSLRGVISYKATQTLTWIFMGVSIAIVIGLFILMNKFTDKEKVAKAKAQARSGSASLPSSAFDFDEDESSK